MRLLGLLRFRPLGFCAATLSALVLALCVAPRPALASTAQVNLSNIAFHGAGACSSSPCEDLNISFDLNSAGGLLPGSMTIHSVGAFGGLTFDGEFGSGLGTAFVWSDSQGMIVTLLTPCTPGQLASSCSLNLNEVAVTCASLSCAEDFGGLTSNPNSGTVSDYVAAPEPSLILQLSLGLLFLAFYGCWTRFKRSSSSSQSLP